MAIIIANDGDKIVATIAARNAIVTKFEGMEVTVLDATADVQVGTGEAGYIWSTLRNEWLLTWKTSKDNLSFITESLPISGGVAVATYAPQSGIVWNCAVIDAAGLELGRVIPAVTDFNIDIGTIDYDGLTLQVTYAYGQITAQIALNAAQNRILIGTLNGALAPADLLNRWYPPIPVTITSVYLSVGEAPSGSVVVDALKNGVSLFTGSKPSLLSGEYRGATVTANTMLAETDYLTLAVLEAAGGSDLTIFISYKITGQ